MLFYYEVAAANDNNWLHSWFIQSITSCFDAIDASIQLPSWDALTAGYVAELQGRPSLRKEFFALIEAYRGVTNDERLMTRSAIDAQGDVAKACATGVCVRAADLPENIAKAAIELGDRLFSLLSTLGIRQIHYKRIWSGLKENICPFCALSDLDHPDLPAEDLDHYLSRKIYPFAAANLANLAPMCSRCNMDFKGAKDVLSTVAQLQRHYPYDSVAPGGVKLSGTEFFKNGDDKPPAWIISLTPENKAEEWDRIFDIRKRYRLSTLDRRYMDWLSEWVGVLPDNMEETPEAIRGELKRWSVNWAQFGIREKSFLKAAYLDLVHETLIQEGVQSEQLLSVILSQISMRKGHAGA